MAQMKCSSWSSGANDTTPGKFTVTKPWRRPRPTQRSSASKEEEEEVETNMKQAE
jgi:hypothetical protein